MTLPEAKIVTAASLEQFAWVRALFRDYQSELPSWLRFPDSEWGTLPGAYCPPEGTLLLAMMDDQPAGCVGLRPFPLPGGCEMKRLYIAPPFRGHKLGSVLIEHIIQAARGLGYTRMRLDTHHPTMRAAVELYRRFGFVEVPAHPMPPTDGLLYMELKI